MLGTARRLEDTRRRSAPGAVLDGVELGDRGGGEAGALRRTLAEAARLSPRCGPPLAGPGTAHAARGVHRSRGDAGALCSSVRSAPACPRSRSARRRPPSGRWCRRGLGLEPVTAAALAAAATLLDGRIHSMRSRRHHHHRVRRSRASATRRRSAGSQCSGSGCPRGAPASQPSSGRASGAAASHLT